MKLAHTLLIESCEKNKITVANLAYKIHIYYIYVTVKHKEHIKSFIPIW